MIGIRESFGAKLLSTLAGTVGLLLTITFVVVRMQMRNEVAAVTERTIRNADTLFEELNAYQQQQALRIAAPFAESRRALAMLDEAIAAGDVDDFADEIDYEILRSRLEDVLLVFTDDRGTPVLSIVGGERITEGDPADVGPLATTLLEGDAAEVRGYRVIDGRMYNVGSLYVELGFRPIGTITYGLPIQSEDVERVGSVGGFDACFFVDDACVVGTAGVDDGLERSLRAAAAAGEPLRIRSDDGERYIQSELLVPEEPQRGMRIIAVPLDAVLAPFDSIQRALFLGGGGALLVSALLGVVLSRSLTRPVRELVAAAGRVADGDYEAEVRVMSRDEIGTLAEAFNDMTRGLLLRERYRSVLNKVVSQDVAEELMRGEVELGGENREISVLFADIRGFTPLTEGMEPQEVIRLLNDCMEHLSRAVDAEGGVVDKFIGDELMAVFGAPAAQEDHARRAVCAAMRMRDGMEVMNAARIVRRQEPLGIGIGIASGIAVAGNMGSTDRLNYTVLGETVNLAARLTDQAKPREILVSGQTLRAAGAGCVAPQVGHRTLKGFSADVEVYSLKAVELDEERDTSADPPPETVSPAEVPQRR